MTLDGAVKEAWAMMVRAKSPMPPAVALDYVLDHADGSENERRACLALLFEQAAEHLKSAITTRMRWFTAVGRCHGAVAQLMVMNHWLASRELQGVAHELNWWFHINAGVAAFRQSGLNHAELMGLHSARRWHAKAEVVMRICQQLREHVAAA